MPTRVERMNERACGLSDRASKKLSACGLPSYLAAVGQAIAERDEEWALNSHAMQLQLLA